MDFTGMTLNEILATGKVIPAPNWTEGRISGGPTGTVYVYNTNKAVKIPDPEDI